MPARRTSGAPAAPARGAAGLAPSAPFSVSPSTIARYFFHDCERFLRFRCSGDPQRKVDGIPQRAFDHSPLMRAILESGRTWEEHVVERILGNRAVVAPGKEALPDRRFGVDETIKRLRTLSPGHYLYQGTLRPSDRFLRQYGLDPALVALRDNHPDLIEVREGDGVRLLRVIDIKRGSSLQLAHRVQVLLYALELETTVEEAGIRDARVDLECGAVWLGGQEQPEEFDLGDFRPHLEQFLRHDLPRILARPITEVAWHVDFRCEWCEYFDHCREQMRRDDDLSRLTNMTTIGKRHLNREGVRTLPELGAFLKRPDADEVLGRCASLSGERHYLSNKVAALGDGQPRLHGTAVPDLPIGEHVPVFLTLPREPLGGATYLAGMLVGARANLQPAVFRPDVRRQLFDTAGKAQPAVLVADAPDRVDEIRRQFVGLLHDVLVDVDTYNRGRDWHDQLGLQVYVHTERDKLNLVAWLLESLREPELAERAMTLLLFFQGPDLILTDEHPDVPVAYPIVVLLNSLGRLLALPVEVSYTLPEALEALGSSFRYARKEYFHYPLGHGLRAEAIHAAWHRGQPEMAKAIRREYRLYLYALRALLEAMRKHAGDRVFVWPPKFTLPPVARLNDPILSRLAFFVRYEGLLGCLEVRDGRSEAREALATRGLALELVSTGGYAMDVVGPPMMEVEQSTFPSWLLVRDSESGRRAQLAFKDYYYRNYPSRENHGPRLARDLAVVAITAIVEDELGFPRRVLLRPDKHFDGDPPGQGERFLLHRRFQDYNADRVAEFIGGIDAAGGGLLLELLRDPAVATRSLPLPRSVESAAARGEAALGLTSSQCSGYRTIRARRAVAVWGPPGTGKTHFLAAAILGLATAHARAGRPFRVLVTAFTHSAIENLLRKIEELRGVLPGQDAERGLAKAKDWRGEGRPPCEVIGEPAMAAWLDAHPRGVVGATVYSCMKARRTTGLAGFDLVVVDEASQVRVPEAAVPVDLVSSSGRLVLAGDDLQLPPIVKGTYPETPEGEPVLHRSIFEAVRGGLGPESPAVQMLLENRRMNDILTGVAAELLYGPDYRPFDESVARRRLPFVKPRGLGSMAAYCLDPSFPMVLVVLDGVQATGENLVEATLVAELVLALRQGLRDERSRPYTDDAAFFRHGVFVVSPHRAQNRAIRRELKRQRSWSSPPFVDTVDKMQGQEADAVVVSYGVSDPEYAQMEGEFIYSLNRLNVAITRARTKSLVCLPRPLLEATLRVLDDPEAALGLAFMRGLVRLVAGRGQEKTFELGAGVLARVLRADR